MTRSAPKVSVVVPAYNAGRYLAELCRSIQAQTFPDFEVLVGDDGSTDATAAVFARFGGDERFRMLRWERNRGANQVNLELLRVARGEFWCNPGADDVWEPAFLERRLGVMERHPRAVILHGKARLIDEDSREITAPAPAPALPRELPSARALAVLLQHNIINNPSVMVRASVTKLVLPGLTTPFQYAFDWQMWILHLAAGFDLLWDPEPVLRYRVHATSLSWLPEKAAVRRAEIRLVPLCALSAARGGDPGAAALWRRWRTRLYRHWLRRALSLRRDGSLRAEWLQLAARAYYGPGHPVSLTRELTRHGLGLGPAFLGERQAQRRQAFRVSGLAEIDDPIFRPGPT